MSKKIISAILSMTIFGGSVSADDRLEDEIVLYVEQELSVLEDVTVEKVLPLYNTSDEVIAYLCMLSPSGYAVYDPIYKNILEFSLEENQKFSEEKHYYIGVTQIYTKEQLDKCCPIFRMLRLQHAVIPIQQRTFTLKNLI